MADRAGRARDPQRTQGAVLNFFERQQAARGTTTKLVVLFAFAVIAIVAVVDIVVWLVFRQSPASTQLGWLVAATVLTLVIIGGGTATKLIALRGGGATVAQSLGATAIDPTTRDPRLRRFVNVVEEMSIASGVPMLRLFVLDREDAINAFAAGYSPADAAVTVTAGALDRLNRDELQGVIGHEFSHVLNGDMRLNVRLIGLLNGILLLGLVGSRFLIFGGGRSRDSKGNPLVLVAIVFIVLGFVGQFFARLIQAAVSRQREWLADASAVQFTRQTSGLVGALQKIAGLPVGSVLRDKAGEKQIGHMLFGAGTAASLFATHPPLAERISALDPSFTPERIEALQRQYAEHPPDAGAEDAALGFAPAATPAPAPVAGGAVRITPADVSARVASVTPDDLARGAALSARLPQQVRTLAGQAGTAVPLVLSLLLDARPQPRERQLAAIAARLGAAVSHETAVCAELTGSLDPLLALPLAGLAAPALAARPETDQARLAATLHDLVLVDGRVSVFEYALTRVVGTHLADAADPLPRSRPGRGSLTSAGAASCTLLSVLAAVGNPDPAAAQRAFGAAVEHLYPGSPLPFRPPDNPWPTLDAGWDVLDSLEPRHKQQLIEAMVVAVADDGVLAPPEAELLRTACALLHCPLPPLIA